MALSEGDKLGPYELIELIGKGGMGEVYRARDTRLGREVALKVSVKPFDKRFEREARAIASLNHPNISTLHDVGPNYLVMELVPGETLAQRISRPVPLAEALHIARQIANALDAAHEKGILHRDLKPANIKITPEGLVKVLDFGLAKIVEPPAPPADSGAFDRSTLTMQSTTEAGVILGTAPYMAPEQARGEAVDKRADIWSFGVVLYELVTRSRPFQGHTLSDTLAEVLTREPDWSKVPAPALPLLRRCLVKDARGRLRDIGDAAAWLDGMPEGAPDSPRPNRLRLAWSVAGIACLLAVVLLVAFLVRLPPVSTPAELVRFTIPLPASASFAEHGDLALSPDGRQLVFAASGEDHVLRLWLRQLSSQEPRTLPGTEDAAFPFWSPDSRLIAFSAAGKLKTFDTADGTVKTVCDIPGAVKFLGVGGVAWGGSWNRDGVIIFGASRLMRVSAEGGIPSALTVLDPSRQETVHAFPRFLPDGRHFLYVRVSDTAGNTGVYVGSTDSKPEQQNSSPLLAREFGAAYVSSPGSGPGQLLLLRNGTLWAQPFDAAKLELAGDPVPIAESVGQTGYLPSYSYARFSVSDTGLLVYRPNPAGNFQLTWFNRQGNMVGTIGEPGRLRQPKISPDGTRVAVTRAAPGSAARDIWIYDRGKGATRLTFGGSNIGSLWSPDGGSIAYLSTSPGKYRIYRKPSSGAGSEQLLFESADPQQQRGATMLDWPREDWILFQHIEANGKLAEWLLSADGSRQLIPLPHNPEAEEFGGKISTDMRWSGYVSNQTGNLEVSVQPLRLTPATEGAPAGQWQVSSGGVGLFRWRNDGKELLYLAADGGVMSVDLTSGPDFQFGPPKLLFRSPRGFLGSSASGTPWAISDATADGQQFLFELPADADPREEFEVVQNWTAALKK